MTKFKKFKVSDLFEIKNTLSFNKDSIKPNGNKIYDYVTRTSDNRGILCKTGFVNDNNINSAGTWSLGLLQMNFFYRDNPWYAGQFVRKVIPKINICKNDKLYFETVLNKLSKCMMSGLVRDVDEKFLNSIIVIPVNSNGDIDHEYIDNYIQRIKAQYVARIKAYLKTMGYPNVESTKLTDEDKKVLVDYRNKIFKKYNLSYIFDSLKRGKRLKSDDRIKGKIPFITAGTNLFGLSDYVGNNINVFKKDSLTIDMFGNTFYRGYEFGADDHITVLNSKNKNLNRFNIQFIQTIIGKSIYNKFSYGKNFYPKDVYDINIKLPCNDSGIPDYDYMEKYIKVIQKKDIQKLIQEFNKKYDLYKDVSN
ncbi:restriction endonuclease subunit S [Fructilactobacillus ixorae]|uniref:Restriction endonuclease subunit S n=1 Tax=Fructilactobacillus ixorae TaxID=1750535 RepID=A0ABY5C471_9LACO|nr:restriction endonuclease subunit S [Fructilactobacillus ixorae]USS92849.1 restriction endonuclease subunit S [Fructilactobacillus ixorae]